VANAPSQKSNTGTLPRSGPDAIRPYKLQMWFQDFGSPEANLLAEAKLEEGAQKGQASLHSQCVQRVLYATSNWHHIRSFDSSYCLCSREGKAHHTACCVPVALNWKTGKVGCRNH